MTGQNFKIIGGGIAGLASALAIANAGHTAKIFEKAAKFEAFGAGLQLGPNAARALTMLGAWDAVKPISYAPPELHIRDGRTGTMLKRLQLGSKFEARLGMPYRVAHRADLHDALLSVVQGHANIAIELGVETDSDTSDYDAVIAADGMWSKTREALFPRTKAIAISDVIHRALIPLPNATADMAVDCVNLWLFPGGHVVHYPVGHPLKLNVVAVTQGQLPGIHFAKAHSTLQSLLALVPAWTNWPAAYVPPLPRWNQNNILLIGDAAHGTVPYLAQGAALALEDAATLGQLLNNNTVLKEIYQTFNIKRQRRTEQLSRMSVQAGHRYHKSGVVARSEKFLLSKLPEALFWKPLDELVYKWPK